MTCESFIVSLDKINELLSINLILFKTDEHVSEKAERLFSLNDVNFSNKTSLSIKYFGKNY